MNISNESQSQGVILSSDLSKSYSTPVHKLFSCDSSVSNTSSTVLSWFAADQPVSAHFSNTTDTVLPWFNTYDLVSDQALAFAKPILRCIIEEIIITLGIPGNIFSLVVFFRQGLRDRVNVLLFSLATADLINLVCHFLLKSDCFVNLRDPVDGANWQTLLQPQILYISFFATFVAGVLIAIMSIDRCFSVTFPLKANRIFSYRRMVVTVVSTYLINFCAFAPTFCLYTVDWRIDPLTQRNTASLVPRKDFAINITIPGLITTFLTFAVKPVSILLVITCSLITVVKLRQATKKRGHMRESQSHVSGAEVRVTRMLLTLSIIYVICELPALIVCLVNYFIPEFFMHRKFNNTFVITYETIFTVTCLNSTANFFAYVILSSKFRSSLEEIAPCFVRTNFSAVFCTYKKSRDKDIMTTSISLREISTSN